MDGEHPSPAGSRRARVALLAAGAAVLLAVTAGMGATLGAAGRNNRPAGLRRRRLGR